jgi:hypothetical protein
MTGLPAVLVLLAQAAASAYGPAPPAKPATASQPPQTDCAAQSRSPKGNEIVICAPKPDGYRLPPDIVEARRLKKQGDSVRPRNPHESYAEHGCAIGPMACTGTPTVNLLAVAAQISSRLAKGQEVGSIFETTPHPSEYQLFQEAKKRREAKEAAAAAKAVQAKAQASASAAQAAPPPKPGN